MSNFPSNDPSRSSSTFYSSPDYMQTPPSAPAYSDYTSQTYQENPNRELSMHQIQWLLGRLSMEDQQLLTQQLRGCGREMTYTFGIPFAAASMGALYWYQRRLPEAKRLKMPWFAYSTLGIVGITLANMFTFNVCRKRSQPLLNKMYEKYEHQHQQPSNVQNAQITYDEMRRRHRGGGSSGSQDFTKYGNEPRVQTGQRTMSDQKHLSQFYTEPTFLSGTPTSSVDPTKPTKSEFNEEFSFK